MRGWRRKDRLIFFCLGFFFSLQAYGASPLPQQSVQQPDVPICTHELRELGFLSSAMGRKSESPRLLLAQHLINDQFEGQPQIYTTGQMWFGLADLPSALHTNPGKELHVRTEMMSEEGQIIEIHVYLLNGAEEEIAHLRFSHEGEFQNSQLLIPETKLKEQNIFQNPNTALRLLTPSPRSRSESRPDADMRELSHLVPISLIRPIQRNVKVSPGETQTDFNLLIELKQKFVGAHRVAALAGMKKAVLASISKTRGYSIDLEPLLAEKDAIEGKLPKRIDRKILSSEVGRPFEKLVKLSSKPRRVNSEKEIEVSMLIKNITDNIRIDLVKHSDGSYQYLIYRQVGLLTHWTDDRHPPQFTLVAESAMTTSPHPDFALFQWDDSRAHEAFQEVQDEVAAELENHIREP